MRFSWSPSRTRNSALGIGETVSDTPNGGRQLTPRLRPESESEISETALCYTRRAGGLGNDFLDEVSESLSALKDSPDRFPIVEGEIRKTLLRRFPYVVLFSIRGDHHHAKLRFTVTRCSSSWIVQKSENDCIRTQRSSQVTGTQVS